MSLVPISDDLQQVSSSTDKCSLSGSDDITVEGESTVCYTPPPWMSLEEAYDYL